ncbi:MAG TPA: ABC transporter permease [Tepidisphaeraceae bacterium]|jgi:putative ABC transport system permease protein
MFTFLIETFLLGLKNLRLHKLRSLLTALGIIFGVAAVIIMVAIGEGSKQRALEQLKQLGAKNILVQSKKPPETSDASSRAQRVLDYGLERTDLVRLREVPGLAKVVALRDTEQKVIRGSVQLPQGNAIGTEPELFGIMNLHIERGHTFDQLQYDRADAVCVLGALAAKQLFPHEEPLGESIQIGTKAMGSVMVTVIGVLEPTGLRAGSDAASIVHLDPDQGIYFPLSLAKAIWHDTVIKRQAGTFERKEIELSEIWLQAKETEDVERLASIAQNVIESSHGDRGDFEIKAPIQILRAAEQTQRMFNFIMVGIASFALVVGGIGIMNIMLASVTERTKEIGIRRALGAKRRHITLQFLIETTVISLTGGVIGILIGAGAARALPWIAMKFSAQSYPTSIAQWSVIGSFMVSGLIGIGFGMYPAIMAARMNPIEALRHE